MPLARNYATPTMSTTVVATTNSLPEPQSKLRQKDLKKIEPELAMTSRKLPTSLKKLGALARLIQHKPLSHAMLQMKFSNRRHGPHLEKLLRNAKEGAVRKGMDEESLVIDQAWVTKGKYIKRMWFKGRGRMAVQRRPRVGIDIRIRDKTTLERRAAVAKQKTVMKMMKGGGLVNKPIYNSATFSC